MIFREGGEREREREGEKQRETEREKKERQRYIERETETETEREKKMHAHILYFVTFCYTTMSDVYVYPTMYTLFVKHAFKV